MKTLKSKILTPMILIIVFVPIVTLLFFNVAMHFYIERTARSDLKEALQSVQLLTQQELKDAASLTESVADELTNAAQRSGLTDARLLIYNDSFGLEYPKSLPDGFISANISRRIVASLKSTDFSDRMEQIRVGKETCLMTGFTITGSTGNEANIVIVSQTEKTRPLIKMVNLILLAIMLIGIGLEVFIVGRITKRVSRQIEGISSATELIGQGNFNQPELDKTDISEFSKLSLSIVHMANRLEASERSQRDFLQNASHELRTPLMSIQGYAEGISSGIVQNAKEAADIINSESRRLNTLVEDLLTLSRIESRTFDRELAQLNLNDFLPEIVQRLGGIAVKQQKRIELSLPSHSSTVIGNEELLGKALNNVISNCLRYAHEKVEIALLRTKNSIVIRIQDDGPGISEDDLPHIFERFYKGKDGNFGLGLAIAKSAVQYIGGDVKAFCNETGATFDIVLNSQIISDS